MDEVSTTKTVQDVRDEDDTKKESSPVSEQEPASQVSVETTELVKIDDDTSRDESSQTQFGLGPAPIAETVSTPTILSQAIEKSICPTPEDQRNDTSLQNRDTPGPEVSKLEICTPDRAKQIPTELPSEPSKSLTKENVREQREAARQKDKEEDKLGIYKALAIKLKKELVKSRDELQRLKDDSQKECNRSSERVKELEETLLSERHVYSTTSATLEARARILKQQLEQSEADLQSLQGDFESYKIRASQVMNQNSPRPSISHKTFEEERYKQLKELNDEQRKRIASLELQLSTALDKNRDLEREVKMFQSQLESMQEKLNSIESLKGRFDTIDRENQNLKLALKQFRSKLKEPPSSLAEQSSDRSQTTTGDSTLSGPEGDTIPMTSEPQEPKASGVAPSVPSKTIETTTSLANDRFEEIPPRLSPSASVKDDSQTNSSSSYDGSTSGYVHIKPTPFEIISRSSVLEDAQNQIDNLTKAYLESESTNSLLSEQVGALKEEIRRMQRGTERMDLAENLEYLKNVVFKFLALDSSQMEQKQRLIPVLSTVLKLSPDETAKLSALAFQDKPSMGASFFKFT